MFIYIILVIHTYAMVFIVYILMCIPYTYYTYYMIYIYIYLYGRLYFIALCIGKSKYVSLWLDIGLAVHSVVKVIRLPNTLGLMAGEEHT